MRSVPGEYELVAPGSLEGVLRLLAEAPGAWTPMAGGTELMVQFGAGRLLSRRLVSVLGLAELQGIAVGPESVRIGAGVTYTQMRQHAGLAQALPLLADAASWTGAVANQNRGTLGGNVCNGSPAADSPPALLAYGADVELVSLRGTRRVAYARFHTGYKQNVLAGDELLLAVHVPRPAAEAIQYLRKVGPRAAQAVSKVALGAVGVVRDGVVHSVGVGLASVSYAPYRCAATEAFLLRKQVDAGVIAQAQAGAAGGDCAFG